MSMVRPLNLRLVGIGMAPEPARWLGTHRGVPLRMHWGSFVAVGAAPRGRPPEGRQQGSPGVPFKIGFFLGFCPIRLTKRAE